MNNDSQKYYVGCDVSDKETALCIVNSDGDIVQETMVPSEPKDIAAYFESMRLTFERVGLEASSLSIWLCRALAEAGYPVKGRSGPIGTGAEKICFRRDGLQRRDHEGRGCDVAPSPLQGRSYRAAATLTQNSARPCKLKEWGRNLRKRSSYKSSTVAVARKLSIILHRMWMDGTEFDWGDHQRKCAGEKRGETEFLIAA